jgi:peptidoglycan/xylan/chitin deacetylase (PgdA/CDA1 family)
MIPTVRDSISPRATLRHFGRVLARRALIGVAPRALLLARGDGPHVYLTFDDGPHAEHTPRILDALGRLGVPATFFVVGNCAAEQPGIIRRMIDEGHAVGHHSFSHSSPRATSARRLLEEVRQTRALLARQTGLRHDLFRPPRGELTVAKLLGLWKERQTVVLWNFDPRDFACRAPEELAAAFARRPPRAGDVVLLHDDNPHLVPILDDLVADVRRRGLEFRALAQGRHHG